MSSPRKCHSDAEEPRHGRSFPDGNCMRPLKDKDTWRWLRMLQEVLEVVDLTDALMLVQCGDEPNVPWEEEPFPVFHPESGDGFWNIPWLNPFHLKALHAGLLEMSAEELWESKIPKVYWRGTLTAPNDVPRSQAGQLPRLKIFELARQMPAWFDVAVTGIDDHLKQMWGKKWVKKLAKQQGVRFAKFEDIVLAAPRYRFLLNLNGVVSSWRLTHLLRSGSVLLLQNSSSNEALFQLLEPWRHYVPIAADLSDLVHTVSLLQDDDALARRLAEAAAELFARRLRPEDTYCFALRTLEASASPKLQVTKEKLELRSFAAAPSMERLHQAWPRAVPRTLRQRLAAGREEL
ncbi:unnamed protein product [Effrenium voratum]|nr:unnamed protein product [Effrenium voratum]